MKPCQHNDNIIASGKEGVEARSYTGDSLTGELHMGGSSTTSVQQNFGERAGSSVGVRLEVSLALGPVV